MINESADVVIVGGGAMGTSTAYHLAELGIRNVVLVEREILGSGSTSKAAGGIRMQFADELNIRIALRSLEEFKAFDERLGADIGLRQVGYLFLLDSARDLERFQEAASLQRSLGVPTQELTPAEIAEVIPQLATGDLVGATFCQLDGHATPEAVVQAYGAAAAARGVRIRRHDPVERIIALGNRIRAVETKEARIRTDTVVCTAGVWSRDVAALAGIDIPVAPEARWIHFTPEAGDLPEQVPLTIDFTTSFYFHREGTGLIFGGREPTIEGVAAPASRRLPLIADLPLQSAWWGYYEMSPDHNAIVGEAAEPSRFLYATGFSGHGFQQSPAVGEHLAELVARRVPTLDLSPFSLERFATGRLREERFVI